jgi:acetyl-CoA carboxylase biotin carboxyl carrier protein
MRASKIRSLIRIVEESNINELEVSSWGRKVSIRKNLSSGNGHKSAAASNPGITVEPKAKEIEVKVAADATDKIETKTNLVEIKSPMVGTFYKSPAPDAKPYVEVGQQVNSGQVVCIVEAMKLMNEIESEISGRIVEVLVENAKPVQYGQALFLVEPA